MLDYDGLGIRIPMLIVSAYAKAGHVSHVHYEHGSILKFVENTFGLARLASQRYARDVAGGRRLRFQRASEKVRGRSIGARHRLLHASAPRLSDSGCRVNPSYRQQPSRCSSALATAAGSRRFLRAPRASRAATSSKIQHIVIIVQENRSFNNLFYGFPGARTATYGYNTKGE